jgi:hypothetical protein
MMIGVPNGTIEAENPAVELRNAEGMFEVTSPYGHVFHVTCRRGTRMSVRAISDPKQANVADRIWRIRRIDSNLA